MRVRFDMLSTIRTSWAGWLTLAVFLNMDQFLFAIGRGPAPKFWFVAYIAFAGMLFLPGGRWRKLIVHPVAQWSLLYLLTSLFWVMWSDSPNFVGVGYAFVCNAAIYFIVGIVSLPWLTRSPRLLVWLLWICLLAGCGSVFYEQRHPHIFDPITGGIARTLIVDRPAGFYLNPNIASAAIVMIAACMLPWIGRMAAIVVCALAMFGVGMTFSRSGMLAWAVLMALAVWRGYLPRVFAMVAGGGIVLRTLAGGAINDWIVYTAGLTSPDVKDRLAWLLGVGQLGGASYTDRVGVARFAIDQYLQAPFLGHGLGYTWSWGQDINTHNLILRHMVEYGLAGLVIFPTLLYAIYRSRPPGSDGKWTAGIVALAVVESMFSHNLLEQGWFDLGLLLAVSAPARMVVDKRVPGGSQVAR